RSLFYLMRQSHHCGTGFMNVLPHRCNIDGICGRLYRSCESDLLSKKAICVSIKVTAVPAAYTQFAVGGLTPGRNLDKFFRDLVVVRRSLDRVGDGGKEDVRFRS